LIEIGNSLFTQLTIGKTLRVAASQTVKIRLVFSEFFLWFEGEFQNLYGNFAPVG
jgi:hypothetical protein